MNILSYIHVHRLPNPTGVGRVIDQLLKFHTELFDNRHRMLVEASLYDQVYRDLEDMWRRMAVIPLPGNTSVQQAKWVYLNKPKAEDYWADVDVVYCPAESYVPTNHSKLVCTIHDVAGFETDLYPETWNRKWQNWKWSRLFNQIAQHADAVVTVSEFSASRIAHFFPALEKKLHVIHNAPHHIFGASVDTSLVEKVESLAGGAPYILVPGGLCLRKNAELILSAIPLIVKKIPMVKLIICGASSSKYTKQVVEREFPNVILAGYVSDELLNALYRHASVVWFPSRYEGFGMPVIEAMVAGAPVVASNVASIPEVAGDAAVLCDLDNAVEHVEALLSIIDSKVIRDDLCARSIRRSAHFTWDASAHKLETLFQSL
ncbi:glycosyltransferase family 1 protein [Pontiellaceae bacterium B12219]|nr:glycosyltransferase family 1 protein [Pontiellaceae bacterium B12219]